MAALTLETAKDDPTEDVRKQMSTLSMTPTAAAKPALMANAPGAIDMGGGVTGFAPGKMPVMNSTATGGATAPAAPPPMTAPAMTAPTPNRLQLATDALETTAKATDPYYQASLRDANRAAAGTGTIGSGGLRTNIGNLAHARGLELDTLRENAINKATEGLIGDEQAKARLALDTELGRGGLEVSRGNLQLARENAGTSAELQRQGLALQEKLGLAGLSAEQQRIAIAQKQQEIESAYQNRSLTLAERNAKLAELTQAQQYELSKSAQTQQASQEAARLQLAKDTLADEGKRFGLSLAQQRELATIVDKTANRSIDINSQQGRNALLVQLAQIMGTPGSNIPASFLAAVQKALGLATDPTQQRTDTPARTDEPTVDQRTGSEADSDTGFG